VPSGRRRAENVISFLIGREMLLGMSGHFAPEAAVKQGRLTSKVTIFVSLDGLQSDTPRESASLGRVYS
jgi:hypothetical protein